MKTNGRIFLHAMTCRKIFAYDKNMPMTPFVAKQQACVWRSIPLELRDNYLHDYYDPSVTAFVIRLSFIALQGIMQQFLIKLATPQVLGGTHRKRRHQQECPYGAMICETSSRCRRALQPTILCVSHEFAINLLRAVQLYKRAISNVPGPGSAADELPSWLDQMKHYQLGQTSRAPAESAFRRQADLHNRSCVSTKQHCRMHV